MKTAHPILAALALTTALSSPTLAGAPNTWQGKGRIALSSDGNKHDNDDWGASAMTLMILAQARLQNHVVLYTHSDHVWASESNDLAEMKESAEGGAKRFGFTKASVFPAVSDSTKAYNAFRDQIVASTAENPLFIIAAGPMHVVGSGLALANNLKPDALNHVTVISHSTWNENHADNSGSQGDSEAYHTGWTWAKMKTAFGSKVNFNHISDQNGTGPNPYSTDDRWSTTNKSYVSWMSVHKDPNINWVYTRAHSTSRYDYSDAGMAWYLVKQGDENGDFLKLKAWVGTENVPTTGVGSPTDAYTYGANWVAFEAEVTTSKLDKWVVRKEGDAKYLKGTRTYGPIGKDYIEFTGNTPDGGNAMSPLVYKFKAPTTGVYQITARMIQNLEGEPWDKCNDMYLKLEGDYTPAMAAVWTKEVLSTNQKFYGRGKDNWGSMVKVEAVLGGTKTHAEPLYNLKKGVEYTMTISGRAQRTGIDFFLVFEKSLALKVGEEVDIASVNDVKYWPAVGAPPVGIDAQRARNTERILPARFFDLQGRRIQASPRVVDFAVELP